ncbi:hypothetical protein Rhe02_02630 [Rhizocola hellebori]|uniref:Uncharacterized protein n=1 Tax=Rhizocola hellebori TaxID=1392758 RepID=A0A8J3Q2K1_9ACTN|nr:hypothetical protein Rhe02_02630 [Rhizocola hellebori]
MRPRIGEHPADKGEAEERSDEVFALRGHLGLAHCRRFLAYLGGSHGGVPSAKRSIPATILGEMSRPAMP